MELMIKCKGSELANIDDLLDFQGSLKTLSDINYTKLKNDLLDLGFSEPISIWINPENKKYILNGHQRCNTIKRMREEGYEIPPIPISIVQADNLKQAKKKVLALTSQFGEMSQAGLLDFCEKNDFLVDDILAEFSFPEVRFINKDWDSDLESVDKIEGNLDGIRAKITIECDKEKREDVLLIIKEALEDLEGIVIA